MRVAGQEEVDLFDVRTGIVLKVTPHVIYEGKKKKIRLLVNIEDGGITGQSVDNIPVIQTSSINTQAIVNENQSLLIGGHFYESETVQVKKVPLLGSIPGLGRLFRSEKKEKPRMERVFLISPTIVKTVAFGERP